jgi:hypothetical protein
MSGVASKLASLMDNVRAFPWSRRMVSKHHMTDLGRQKRHWDNEVLTRRKREKRARLARRVSRHGTTMKRRGL